MTNKQHHLHFLYLDWLNNKQQLLQKITNMQEEEEAVEGACTNPKNKWVGEWLDKVLIGPLQKTLSQIKESRLKVRDLHINEILARIKEAYIKDTSFWMYDS